MTETVEIKQETVEKMARTLLKSLDAMSEVPEIIEKDGIDKAMHRLGQRTQHLIHNIGELDSESEEFNETLEQIYNELETDIDETTTGEDEDYFA